MAQVKVHDVSYDLPESFTLGEMRIVERYCQGQLEGEFTIGKVCASIHVAIARAKPDLSFDEIQAVVDDLPADELDAMFETVAGQSPPALTDASKNESNGSSSDDSDTSSDATPASETPETSGSPDLAGFRSFHARSSS